MAIEGSKQGGNSTGSHLPGLWSFLWRGALGGTIGSLIDMLFYMYRIPYARLFLLAFLMLLWIPAAYGSLVGLTLYLLSRKRRHTGLNLVMRAFVGIGTVAMTCWPYVYFSKHKFVTAIGGNLLGTVVLDSIMTGVIIGLPAGLMAPRGRHKHEEDH